MLVQYEPWVFRGPFPEEIPEADRKEMWGVKIVEGEFSGTTLSFNNIDIKEDSNNLQLDYTIIHTPEGQDKEYCSGPNFENALQHIIVDILNKAVETYENRKSNTPESDSQ